MENFFDLSLVDQDAAPTVGGVRFDSRPAALRHVAVANKIMERYRDRPNIVGVDIGSKYGYLRTLINSPELALFRMDIVMRDDTAGLFLGNGTTIPLRSESVDFFVVSHVLAHIDNLDPFFCEVRRVLKPGGHLFILQNNALGWWKFWGYYLVRNDRKYHFRTFTLWGIQQCLARGGLLPREVTSPYYFYLHSKYSDWCYRMDRRHGKRVPLTFATQWMITAEKPDSPENWVPPSTPGYVVRSAMVGVAFVQSVSLKAFELYLRAVVKVAKRATGTVQADTATHVRGLPGKMSTEKQKEV